MGNRSPCEFWGKGFVTGLRPDPLQEESGGGGLGRESWGGSEKKPPHSPTGEVFAGGLCPVWVPPPGIKLLRETLGLLLGEAGRGGSGGERGQVDLAPLCLPVTALHPDRLPRVMATTSPDLPGLLRAPPSSSPALPQGYRGGELERGFHFSRVCQGTNHHA